MNNMNILLCSSNEFSLAAYVLIESIIDNNDQYKIRFYFTASDDIDCADDLKEFVEAKGHEFYYIHLDKEFFLQFKTQNKWTEAVFLKLTMHEYLPKDIDKVLYMDIDTICDGSLNELYEIDLGDKYVAACSNSVIPEVIEEYNHLKKRDETIAANGSYINTGVALFNIAKIRQDITIDTIMDAYENCLQKASRYLADQSVLNWLYCENTKYLNPLDYNYRIALSLNANNKSEIEKKHKRAIIHYVSRNQPYKPWDIWLTEEETSQINEMPFEAPYIYMTKEVNDLIGIWWKYAQRTPVYDVLYSRMLIKKEWFMVYGITTINSITKYLNNNKSVLKRCGYLENRRNRVIKSQNTNNFTFLKSLYSFWKIECDEDNIIVGSKNEATDLFSYLREIQSNDDYVLIISTYHTAVGHWKEFIKKQELGLNKLLVHCESYCAIIDCSENVLIEKSGKGLQKIDYILNSTPNCSVSTTKNGSINIEVGQKNSCVCITSISQGYDLKTNSVISNIIINNIDYSMSKRGLNLVVYSKKKGMVIDSLNVDVHGDDSFKIVRTI